MKLHASILIMRPFDFALHPKISISEIKISTARVLCCSVWAHEAGVNQALSDEYEA